MGTGTSPVEAEHSSAAASSRRNSAFALPAGNSPNDDEGLGPRRDDLWQRGIGRFVGQILLTGEEAQERTALLRDLVADRTAQHRIAGLEGVQDRALRDWALDVNLQLAPDLRQGAEMLGKDNSDHLCHRLGAATIRICFSSYSIGS